MATYGNRQPSDPVAAGSAGPTLPMTAEALRRLKSDVRALMEGSAPVMPATGAGVGPGSEAFLGMRRLQTLIDAVASARVVTPDGRIVIGSRVVLRESDGPVATYTVVAPGQGQPALGLISTEVPLGLALLGHRIGERVSVDAPGGGWTVEVIDVSVPHYPEYREGPDGTP